MFVKTRAIVISIIKYQEKSLIVKCLTLSDGLKTYFVHDAFSNKKSKQKIGYFQPLTILEIESVHRNNGALEYFKEIKLAIPLHSIYSDITKSTIVLFVSEILNSAIREEEKNEALYYFIETSLQWLDNHSYIANFHLILMIEITKYFGFYPQNDNTNLKYFDLKAGVFLQSHSIDTLSENESDMLKKLINLKFVHSQKTFNVFERQVLLKILIDYYTIHLDSFRKPKSLEILKEVFV